MLDQFYSYLSSKIVEFFTINPLIPGAKYNIQFETDEQVRSLYEKLKNNTLYKDYKYKDSNGDVKYNSYQLEFQNGVNLIISATIDDVQPDFLTRLRNMVGAEPGYENKAILFIHNTTLDSIMGGTESFTKEGMPFHVESIQKDIKTELTRSGFSDVDEAIIYLDLERKKNILFQDNNSVFEYKEILDIVNKGYIEQNEYSNFGIFYDSKLKNVSKKDLNKRLKENEFYYSRVDEIHNYGNPETQLERYFEEKGIDKLKGSEWRSTDFKDVEKSVEEKKRIKPLEYISSNVEWDKEEGNSKAKSRIRNIIVFNENKDENVDLEFNFDDYIKNEYITSEGELTAIASGKKIKATIRDEEGKSNFYKVICKNDKGIKFEFKILMLKCSPKYLESIKAKYSIIMKKKEKYISIKSNDSKLVFNEFANLNTTYNLDCNNDVVEINNDEIVTINIAENFEYENDNELIRFDLKIDGELIPIGVIGTSEKIAPIEGLKVWKLKREKKSDFKFIGDNKLQHGTKEYFTREDFRKNLNLEREIISLGGLYFIESIDRLESIEIDIDDNVKVAYDKIINYYNISNRLPSLTYLNDDLKVLYQEFVSIYLNTLNEIKEGTYLNNRQKNLLKVGLIKRNIEDKELLFTPIHPLNIAYQLKINNAIGCEVISDEVIKKFTSTYLLPYLMDDDDKLFIPMEQQHSPEWKYYVYENLPRYKSSRDFVSKLVNEKIDEFIGHFKYMFDMGNNAPIRINLINTGDSKEILQGIFKYYVKQLRGSKTGEVLPMELFIYSNKCITNAFEELSFNEDIDNIKESYNLDLNVDNMTEEDVLNLYREKVHFYSKKLDEEIEYAHITFLEMNSDVKVVKSNMSDIPTGIILDGWISGVPSVFLGDSYRTGFGTKYANKDSDLIDIAIKLNALNAASSGEPFDSDQCKAISVPNKSKLTLDNIYNASHWVTFINPKVDLNFFKNDPDAKDLLIIHYSDQYTTAGGYDAITVTKKSGPYQRVIEEFLTEKGLENAHDYSPGVINMFNAINGDWLLRLLSSKSYFPKEKISILSAIKLALAEFKSDNFIWVPISLEEILRVSGGAGLKQSEGLFSAKNLGFENGATSDDILLVGIEKKAEQVIVHYYPVEVKIGGNDTSVIQKGIEQAKSTKRIFNKILLPDENGVLSNTQKVYRNFLMQLVVTSAEKLNLYNVCDGESWTDIIDSDLRRKLLNEEYTIIKTINKSMGEAAVISFKRGITFNDIRQEDDVTIIEMSEDEGISFITKTIEEIREIVNGIEVIETEITQIDIDNKDKSNIEIKEEANIVQENDKQYERATKEPSAKVIDEPLKKETIIDSKLRNMEILFGINQKNRLC